MLRRCQTFEFFSFFFLLIANVLLFCLICKKKKKDASCAIYSIIWRRQKELARKYSVFCHYVSGSIKLSLVAERHKDVRTIVKVVSEKRNKGKKGIYSKMKLVKWRTFVKEKRKTHDCGYIYIFFHSNSVYTVLHSCYNM